MSEFIKLTVGCIVNLCNIVTIDLNKQHLIIEFTGANRRVVTYKDEETAEYMMNHILSLKEKKEEKKTS